MWILSSEVDSPHVFSLQKIDDQDGISHTTKDHAEGAAQGIPAQDYEKDILPRYKTALSMGLTSCKKFLNSKDRGHKTNSVFRVSSVFVMNYCIHICLEGTFLMYQNLC